MRDRVTEGVCQLGRDGYVCTRDRRVAARGDDVLTCGGRRDVEAVRGRAGQARQARRVERVAGAGLVDRQVAEGRDAAGDGRRLGAGEGSRAGVGPDRDRDAGRVVAALEVVELVEDADRDGGADRDAGDRAGRLLAEGEVVGG